jgi:hypothetical protein
MCSASSGGQSGPAVQNVCWSVTRGRRVPAEPGGQQSDLGLHWAGSLLPVDDWTVVEVPRM